jgi:hypothetical protein
VDHTTAADTADETVEGTPRPDRRPPPDDPGSDSTTTRADSRVGAAVANDGVGGQKDTKPREDKPTSSVMTETTYSQVAEDRQLTEADAAKAIHEDAEHEMGKSRDSRHDSAMGGGGDDDPPDNTPGIAEPEEEGDDESGAAQEKLQADSERDLLYRFGNKETPRPARLFDDMGVNLPEDFVGPFIPLTPNDKVFGMSTYIDPQKVPLSGHYHVLSPHAVLPDSLGVHADGVDVGGPELWGHRTIYPKERMTAAHFNGLCLGLDWNYVEKKKG